MGSRFQREAVHTLFCGLVYAFGQWLLLKLLFRSGGAESAGWYAYAMAVITPVMSFGSLGLRSILVTDAKGEFTFNQFFSFRLFTSGLFLVVSVVLFFALPAGREGGVLGAAFVGLAVYRSIEWVSDLAQGEYQKGGRMRVVLASYLLKLLAGAGLFAFAILASGSISLGFVLIALANLAVLLFYELNPARLGVRPTFCFDWPALRHLGKLALPVGPILLIAALQSSIPRYILEEHQSLQVLGVFAALMYLGSIGGFVGSAIGGAASPLLAEHWAAGRFGAFRRVLLAMLAGDAAVALISLAVFFAAGETLLRLMFNEEVARSAGLLPLVVVVLLASFWDSHLGCVMTVFRQFKKAMLIQILKVLVVTPVAIYAIDRWGLSGALAVSGAFHFFSVLGFAAIILRKMRDRSMAGVIGASPAMPSQAA